MVQATGNGGIFLVLKLHFWLPTEACNAKMFDNIGGKTLTQITFDSIPARAAQKSTQFTCQNSQVNKLMRSFESGFHLLTGSSS